MAEHNALTFATKLLTMFIDLFQTETFQAAIKLEESKPSSILEWIVEQDIHEAKSILQLMVEKNMTRKGNKKTFRSMFRKCSIALQELGTEQIKQILKAATALTMYGEIDKRVLEMYRMVFLAKKIGPGLIVGTRYIPSKCNRYHAEKESKFRTNVPRLFEVIMLFHAFSFCTDLAKKRPRKRGFKGFKTSMGCGNRLGFAVQLIVNAWSSLARHIGLGNCEDLVAPYLSLKKDVGQFITLGAKEDGFAPKSMRQTFEGDDRPAKEAQNVNPVAWGRNEESDAAFRNIAEMFLSHLQELISTDHLYECPEDQDWAFVKRYRYKKGSVAPVFNSLPEQVKERICYWGRPLKVTELDKAEGGKMVKAMNVKTVKVVEEDDIQPATSTRKRKFQASKATTVKCTLRLGASMVEKENDIADGSNGGCKPSKLLRTDITFGTRSEQEFHDLYHDLVLAMKPYCRIYDVCFRELIETDADGNGAYLDGLVNFIATDPPYMTRSERNSKNSSHDKLSKEDMAECVQIFSRLLRKGGHGVVFCSNLQFKDWYNFLTVLVCDEEGEEPYFAGEVSESGQQGEDGEDKEDYDAGESERDVSQPFLNKKPYGVFGVEKISQIISKAPGHYFQNPGQKKLNHMSVAESYIHFWKRGLPFKEALKTARYKNYGHVPSQQPAWTNVIDNVPRIEGEERVLIPAESGKGTDGMLRPEQKNVALMKELVERYTEPGDIVVDMFGGTFSTAKACLGLEKHRIFVGCDFDEKCVKIAIPWVVKLFAAQLTNLNSSIQGSVEESEKAKNYLSHPKLNAREAGQYASGWDAPPGLPMYQKLPTYVTRYLSCLARDTAVGLFYRQTSPDSWPREYFGLLNTVDVFALCAFEAAVLGFVVCKSTIKNLRAGDGVFAMQSFAKGETLMNYYGTFVYRSLYREKKTTKEYGNGILAVRKKRFCQTAVELPFKVKDEEKMLHPVFIVPAPFCVASYINDPRYLPGDEDGKERETDRKRTANVRFHVAFRPTNRRSFQSNKLVEIVATRRVESGQELFLDYGSEFSEW